MDPREFLTPSMPSARRNKVVYFDGAAYYQDWIDENPYVEIISVVSHSSNIVITYKEPF